MEYQTHNAVVQWGENIENMTEEKMAEIQAAIKALIDALDYTQVETITFSKIETDGTQENTESGGTEAGA